MLKCPYFTTGNQEWQMLVPFSFTLTGLELGVNNNGVDHTLVNKM
jgi:hypothetical protein